MLSRIQECPGRMETTAWRPVSKPVIKRQICLHFAIFPKTGFYTLAWAASDLAICFGVGSTIIRRPYFGRSVISGCGTTEKPGTSRGV